METILTSNPKAAYSLVKSNKNTLNSISKLHVGNEVFTDTKVADGFHQSIAALKKSDPSRLKSKTFSEFVSVCLFISHFLRNFKA